MSCFVRVSAGWWEVMRVSAPAILEAQGSAASVVRCKQAVVLGRLHPEEEESRAGPMWQ
jgi:hypothetical protein